MQDWRFDNLTRTLGHATSRRGVLKGLLGGVAALVVGRALDAPDAAAAQCSVEQCKQDALREFFQYESTTCNSLCHDRNLFLACVGCRITANRLLNKWTKDCESGDGCLSVNNSICCGGTCVDSTSDSNNCGTCGNVCAPGTVCQYGKCQCGGQGIECDGQCVDPRIDAQHCGSCDHACATCETCDNGQCVAVECGAGQVCCKDQCVNACTSGDMDPTTCTCGCPPGQKLCGGGACTDILNSDFNCGDCDVMCSGGQTCQNGVCACPGEQPTYCSGSCVNVANDTDNCGSCGSQCGSNQICSNGTCQSCPSGQTFCGGTCVSTTCQPNETFNAFTCSCQQMCDVGVTYCKDDPSNGYVCCADGYCFNDESYGHRCCPNGHYCIDSNGAPSGCCGGTAVPTYPYAGFCHCCPQACVQDDGQCCPTCQADFQGNGYCA